MRDEDGTYIIEITPFVRIGLMVAATLLITFFVWRCGFYKPPEQTKTPSRVPGDILPTDEFGPDTITLELLEQSAGIDPEVDLNMERLSQVDRDELETIYNDLASRGFPRLDSEEALLYEGLIERSAEIAPYRTLKFFELFEDTRRMHYSTKTLFENWLANDADKAMEHLSALPERLRLQVLSESLLELAETNPERAFALALRSHRGMFSRIQPDLVRPVARIWAQEDFDDVLKKMRQLQRPDGGRDEVLHGLTLAKLDTVSNWSDAASWARSLGSGEDGLRSLELVAEYGIAKYPEDQAAEDLVKSFPNRLYQKHLMRALAAKKLIVKHPPEKRLEKSLHLLRSTDPLDPHGRMCVINTFEDESLRERDNILLRFRWPDLGETTYLADGYLLPSTPPMGVPATPLKDLLELGDRLLAEGKYEEAREPLLQYLYYNPEVEEIYERLNEYSRQAGTSLGPNAELLDQFKVKPASLPVDSDMYAALNAVKKQFEEQAKKPLDIFIFEAVTGRKPTPMWAWGEYGEVSVREALDVIMENTLMSVSHEEFGIVGFYWRDEDIAVEMGVPAELLEYHIPD